MEHDFPVIGRRILLLNARRISRPPDKAQWILLAFEDVTERMEMERAAGLRGTLSRGPLKPPMMACCWSKRPAGRSLIPTSLRRICWAIPNESLQKKNLWELGILKDEAQFRQTALELEKQGVVGLADMTIPTKQGGHFPADVYLTDKATVIQCNIRDISERKRAEEALQALKGKYRAIFENAMEGIFQSTPEGVSSPSILPSRGCWVMSCRRK